MKAFSVPSNVAQPWNGTLWIFLKFKKFNDMPIIFIMILGRKHKIHSLLLVQNMWPTKFKRGKAYFGSGFHKLQPIVSGLRLHDACGEAECSQWKGRVGGNVTSWQRTAKGKEESASGKELGQWGWAYRTCATAGCFLLPKALNGSASPSQAKIRPSKACPADLALPIRPRLLTPIRLQTPQWY